MAGAGGMPPPLRLKDLLELDCDSCSAAGFRCYPRRLGESASAPMRHLLESSPSLTLRRHRPSKLSHLSRSLSRRLSRRGGFWSRRRDEEGEDTASAAASAGCGGSSSCEELELETSSSESSDNYSSGRTSRRRSRSESDSDLSSATEDSVHHPPSQAAGAGDEHEVVAMKRVSSKEGSSSLGSEADDKEQLSPVAVMDFPFDDDDDDELRDAAVACTPSFSLARLQRYGRTWDITKPVPNANGHNREDPAGPTSPVTIRKGRKTHKIRRFGSHDELGPLDLEARLAATTSDPDADGPAAADSAQAQQMIQCRTEDASTPKCAGSAHRGAGGVHDVPDEDDLTSLLMGTVSGGLDDVSERLLRDFLVEMKRRRSEAHDAESELPLPGPAAGGVLRRKAERVVDGEAAVAAAARGWLEATGTERWGLADVLSGGAAIVAEMERGRGWMQVGEEEREVGAVVAGMLVNQLVGEVVRCLFV